MKKSKFGYLYSKYKNTPLSSGKRPGILKEMFRSAESFDDWAIVYRYVNSSHQYYALKQMKKKVLEGKTSSEVRRNITKLFSIVTDEKEQSEILEAFLSKYDSEDNSLFVLEVSSWDVFSNLCDMPDDIEAYLQKKEKEFGVAC